MQINRHKHFFHQIILEFLRNPTFNAGHTPTGNITYKTGSEWLRLLWDACFPDKVVGPDLVL